MTPLLKHSVYHEDTMKIQDKVFVVTGAGGGIGGELVRILLEKGAKVAAIDLKDESLQTLSGKLAQYKNDLTVHTCDIANRQAVSALPAEIKKTHGQIDALINCAGIIQPFVKVNDLDYEAIDRVMNVNFYGTLNMTKAFLPELLTRPEAYLVNYSSMGGFLPVPGQSVYGASKAAIKLLTEGLYAELLHTNVHVSVVFPGSTQTDIAKNSGVTFDTKGIDTSKMPTLPADKSAAKVIKGIEKNKPHIYTGTDSKTMNLLYRLTPVFATKFITKKMQSLLK